GPAHRISFRGVVRLPDCPLEDAARWNLDPVRAQVAGRRGRCPRDVDGQTPRSDDDLWSAILDAPMEVELLASGRGDGLPLVPELQRRRGRRAHARVERINRAA